MKDQKATFEQPGFGGSRIASNTGENEIHTDTVHTYAPYVYIYVDI